MFSILASSRDGATGCEAAPVLAGPVATRGRQWSKAASHGQGRANVRSHVAHGQPDPAGAGGTQVA